MANPRGRRQRRSDYLRRGTLPVAILLPDPGPRRLRSGRDHSRPHFRELYQAGRRTQRGAGWLGVRAAHGGRVSQYRGGHRCRRRAAWAVPQDAHSRRSAVLREVLFHAGRSRLSLFRHALRAHRAADLLGPVVSRSRPSGGPRRRADSVVSDGHRIPPFRRGRGRHPAECMGDHPACTRHRQRGLRGRRESRGPRRSRRRGPHVLGRVLRLRSTGPHARQGRRCRGDADCGMRSARDRIGAPQLAVPARPPDGRLRTNRQPGDRLNPKTPPKTPPATPHNRGFRMPAEWEPHEATWMAWPHNREDWPGRFTPIPLVYGEIVRKLASVERVRILVESPALETTARRILHKVGANLDAVEFFQRETDRVWTRDYGPLFVKNISGDTALTAWRFNAWAKYDDWHKDAAIPAFLGTRLKLPVFTRSEERRVGKECRSRWSPY